MGTLDVARRGAGVARGLRWLSKHRMSLDEARRVIADEVARRPARFNRTPAVTGARLSR